jgi:hypothetical protein
MSDSQVFVLEEGWRAQTGRVWKFQFQQTRVDDEHFYFQTSCTAEEGEPFLFVAQVSRALLDEIGVDPVAKPKLLMRVAAGASLADLKVRLNAGHDTNRTNQPYCKTYTRRDRDKFARFLPH